MTTNLHITKRAVMTGRPVATLTFARYQGAAERRVVCPSASALNTGGRLMPAGAFLPEGLWHEDRRQLQN